MTGTSASAPAISTAIDSLSPSEVEDLHIRLATQNSLTKDSSQHRQATQANLFSVYSQSREADPVPTYSAFDNVSKEDMQAKIRQNNPNIWNSIFREIETDNVAAIDYFISLGLDVNTTKPYGENPLYHAVAHNQVNMMRHLLNCGAEVNSWSQTRDTFDIPRSYLFRPLLKRTPLMCAAEKGRLAIVKILCETAFADPMLVSPDDGQTALRLAARNGHREIVQYLPANRGGAWLRIKCTALLWYCLSCQRYTSVCPI
jgi:ankyrin repeat protein